MTLSSPPLEMLWEDAVPSDVLRERFGFASAAEVQGWLAQALRGGWGIEVDTCHRIVMSAANALAWLTTSQGALIAKWSVDTEHFGRLARLGTLLGWLDDEGVPVSAPLPTTDGRVQVEIGGSSLAVQRVIAGDLLDVARLDDVRATGHALAHLHERLASYPDAVNVVPRDTPARSLRRLAAEWAAGLSAPGCDDARAVLQAWLTAAPDPPTRRQLVHGDVRSANVLCDGGEVTAFLDFDEARWDLPVMEVARASVLLGTQFHEWGPVSPEIREAFVTGYESVHPFSEVERSWNRILVLLISLLMVPDGDDPAGWRATADAAAQDGA